MIFYFSSFCKIFQISIWITDKTFGHMIYGFLQLIAKFSLRYYAVTRSDKSTFK